MKKLITFFPEYARNFFTQGHSRSIKAKKNVAASLFIKGLDLLIGILLVPLLLGYLGKTSYGIWLTMLSIVAWFGFFDIGFGQGLRNRFAEAKAVGDDKKARIYVSTTYAVISILAIGLCGLFLVINSFIPWEKIFNTAPEKHAELSMFAVIVFGFFLINLAARLITTIIVADQKPAVKDAIHLAGRILIAVYIFVLIKTTPGSLPYAALGYAGIPVVLLVFMAIFFFNKEYYKYRPSLRLVDFKYSRDLINLGGKFFVIQIALVIILSTDNIIISQLYGPHLVAPYQIAGKYFSLTLMVFYIIVNPVWSASSEAFAVKDFKWIKSAVNRLKPALLFFISTTVVLLVISRSVYDIWVGKDIGISFLLSVLWMLFTVVGMVNGLFCSVINGLGKIRLQMYIYIFNMLINIPLSVFFAKTLDLGIEGVILATVLCQTLLAIYLPIQYKRIMTERARGIWNA